jgi:hypothetical protein
MRKKVFASTALFALAILALLPIAAQAGDMKDATTLTGQLSYNNDGSYALTEEASGDSILLTAAADTVKLGDHIGKKVKVTGTWSSDKTSFSVSRVEAAPAPPAE